MTAPTFSHGLPGYLSDAQLAQLLKPINGARVSKDGKGFSHVEAYEIRAHLNRIFGIARWSERVVTQELVFEAATGEAGKARWTVCYRSLVELTVCDPTGKALAVYTEGATGDATNMPSRADAHDMALKTSQSQAFKRCAMNLGDQFGLSLYNKGSLRPLVMRTLVGEPDTDTAAAPAEPDAHITTPLAPENGEPQNPQRETSSLPPSTRPSGVEADEPAVSPAAENPTPVEVTEPTDPAQNPDPVGAPPDPDPAAETADAWAQCLAILAAIRAQSPAEAMQSLRTAMELAVKYRLRNRLVPDAGVTLGAMLEQRMRQAATAAETAARPQPVGAEF